MPAGRQRHADRQGLRFAMMKLFHESLCHGLQPAWNPDRPRRPVNGLPAPATVLAVASLDSSAYAPSPTVSMLRPKSQRENNVEQLDPQERQNPPPPFDTVYHGDCIDIMATMPPASVDFKGPAFTVDEGVNSALPIDEQKIDETVLALLY